MRSALLAALSLLQQEGKVCFSISYFPRFKPFMLTFASIVEKWFIARYAILCVKKFSVLRLSLLDTALGNNIKTC